MCVLLQLLYYSFSSLCNFDPICNIVIYLFLVLNFATVICVLSINVKLCKKKKQYVRQHFCFGCLSFKQPLFLRAGFCLVLMVLFFRCLPDDLLGRNDLQAKLLSLLGLHLLGGGVPRLPVYHPEVMTVKQPLSQQFFFLGHLHMPPSLLFQRPDLSFLLLCLTSWFSG